MREFLKGLELDKETIDTIMAEYGKNVQGKEEKIGDLTKQIEDFKSKVEELTKEAENSSKNVEELNALKEQIKRQEEETNAKKQEEMLNNNINEVLGDKKFVNDFTKQAIINQIKDEVNKDENKDIQEIFDNLTKDCTNIFESENKQVDMTGMGEIGKIDDNVNVGEIKLNPMFKNYNN